MTKQFQLPGSFINQQMPELPRIANPYRILAIRLKWDATASGGGTPRAPALKITFANVVVIGCAPIGNVADGEIADCTWIRNGAHFQSAANQARCISGPAPDIILDDRSLVQITAWPEIDLNDVISEVSVLIDEFNS